MPIKFCRVAQHCSYSCDNCQANSDQPSLPGTGRNCLATCTERIVRVRNCDYTLDILTGSRMKHRIATSDMVIECSMNTIHRTPLTEYCSLNSIHWILVNSVLSSLNRSQPNGSTACLLSPCLLIIII